MFAQDAAVSKETNHKATFSVSRSQDQPERMFFKVEAKRKSCTDRDIEVRVDESGLVREPRKYPISEPPTELVQVDQGSSCEASSYQMILYTTVRLLTKTFQIILYR